MGSSIYIQGVKVGGFSADDLTFADDVPLTLGDDDDSVLVYSTDPTNDQLRLGLSSNMTFSVLDKTDIAHTTNFNNTRPTLQVHGTDHNEWGSFSHDGTNFRITTDSGSKLRLMPSGAAVTVGLGNPSHVSTGDDLYVGRALEVGGAQFNKTVVVGAATYSLLTTDYLLFVDYTATGTVAITLPTAQSDAGRTVIIKDSGYNASGFNITIGTGGAELIENGATLVLSTDGQAVTLTSDGTDWHVVG